LMRGVVILSVVDGNKEMSISKIAISIVFFCFDG